MKQDGQADQAEGKLQNTWGSIKDEARRGRRVLNG
jgi:uncharacterized protein YjbJ (UPF0337 family)